MVKRLLALILGLVLLTAGCALEAAEQDVSLYDLSKQMLAADDTLPEMTTVNDSSETPETLFVYLSDLEYEKVEHFFLSYSTEGKADEIAIIAVKDPADAAAAQQSLERHIQSRQKLYDQYDPDQAVRVKEAQVFTQGQYAVLILCDKGQQVREAFEKAVGK